MSKWEARRERITQMVERGMSDEEIGQEYGVGKTTMYHARKLLGIPTNRRRKEKGQGRCFTPKPLEVEPLIGETYTDADGLTVTRYPARFAGGTDPRITARGKR